MTEIRWPFSPFPCGNRALAWRSRLLTAERPAYEPPTTKTLVLRDTALHAELNAVGTIMPRRLWDDIVPLYKLCKLSTSSGSGSGVKKKTNVATSKNELPKRKCDIGFW